MKLAIMQPYFLPYIGYFQLIAAVDDFIVYDNIKYTKKGWINRNRMLVNGQDSVFSLPIKKASDSLDVRARCLADDFSPDKLLAQFKGAYSRAPFFLDTFSLLESILLNDERNLFDYIFASIVQICKHLGIKTKIHISSAIDIDHQLKGQEKVLELCKAMGAATYINTSGGMALYSPDDFGNRGVDLKFIKSTSLEYPQLGLPFIPWLSIIDVLMFNSPDKVREYIFTHYELI
ncbi:WbqC-like protein [Pseudomonas sp. IT-P12]|uniref:WbqC family protein n=1 Tax=Pseudomonas sp. IT-P12 TaxID=3026450 RepID=UPI0039E024D5